MCQRCAMQPICFLLGMQIKLVCHILMLGVCSVYVCGVLMGSACGANEACVCCCTVRCCRVCLRCWCGVRLLLMGYACAHPAANGACMCTPISCTRMPHQQQTHPTSAAHAHPVATHRAATHTCLISTTRTLHQHPTHIYTYTLLTLDHVCN